MHKFNTSYIYSYHLHGEHADAVVGHETVHLQKVAERQEDPVMAVKVSGNEWVAMMVELVVMLIVI